MEYFDILNDKGESTGKVKSRDDVHRDGDWHRTVHCWLLNKKGELLLQLRGPNQESNPNKWDISCAGHISAGEDQWGGVIRECEEELGVSFAPERFKHLVTCRGEFFDSGLVDREFSEVFIVEWDEKDGVFSLCSKEVSELKWMPWRELKTKIEISSDEFVEHDEEYLCLFDYLEEHVEKLSS